MAWGRSVGNPQTFTRRPGGIARPDDHPTAPRRLPETGGWIEIIRFL
jgi:hypothetical protein